MRAVEHDGGEACLYALVAALVSAVVKVQRNGNGYLHLFYHGLYHGGNRLKARHVFAGAFRNAEDDGSVEFLCGGKYALCPFKVVYVELADSVFAVSCLFKHLFCRN